jgi:hypothetical protein
VPRDDVLAARKTAGFSGSPASTGPGDRTAEATGEIARRLMRAMAAEAEACCAEGVVTHLDDVDVASVRAGGFPAWTGGVGRWRASTHSPGAQAPAPPG